MRKPEDPEEHNRSDAVSDRKSEMDENVFVGGEEKMERLTSEIAKCFEESNRLQEQIKKNLEAIGYGM